MSRMLIQYKALPISLRSWRTSVFTSDFASHVNISWIIFWQPTIKAAHNSSFLELKLETFCNYCILVYVLNTLEIKRIWLDNHACEPNLYMIAESVQTQLN
jgi:hypothetical protein